MRVLDFQQVKSKERQTAKELFTSEKGKKLIERLKNKKYEEEDKDFVKAVEEIKRDNKINEAISNMIQTISNYDELVKAEEKIKSGEMYKEFKDKYLNDEKYLELYNQWLKNNCLSDYKPSFDRIDNTKDYSFDNLQIMTWRENNAKGRRECMKAVRQYDLSGNYIKTYSSIIEASKEYNINKSNISACCKNKLHKTGGYISKYAED